MKSSATLNSSSRPLGNYWGARAWVAQYTNGVHHPSLPSPSIPVFFIGTCSGNMDWIETFALISSIPQPFKAKVG